MVGSRNPFTNRADPELELGLVEEAVEAQESHFLEALGSALGVVIGRAKAEPITGAGAAVVIDKMFSDGVAHLPASQPVMNWRTSKRRMRRLRGKAKAAK
jgi:hypothetical protein